MFEVMPQIERVSEPGNGLASLMDRARRGETDVLPSLRAALDASEALRERAGDLALHAERSWVALIAGDDLVFSEALARKVEALAAEIAGPAPTPLEKLLSRRVVTAWLVAHHADAGFAQNAKNWSIKQASFGLDRMDRASRRLNAAIGALASLRKLLPNNGRPDNSVIPPEFAEKVEVGQETGLTSGPSRAVGEDFDDEHDGGEAGDTIAFKAARREGSPGRGTGRCRGKSRAKKS